MSLRIPGEILLSSLIAIGMLFLLERQTGERALANSAFQEGPTEADLEEAFRNPREQLRRSSEYAGSDADAHIRLAETLHHRGDLTGASEEYQAAIKLNPQLTKAYRGLGVLCIDRHDWKKAVEALSIATDHQPHDAEAFYWLGRALMARGDWKKASEALTTAARLKPDDAEAYADLGLIHMVQGNPAAAVEALQRAVMLKPDNADAHALLETVLTHQQNPEHVTRVARQMLNTMFARE